MFQQSRLTRIKETLAGRWVEVITALHQSEEMQTAIERGHTGHGWCPVHGGNHGDAFRIFKNFADTGGVCCNTCGNKPNGVETLMWLNGWSVAKVASELERYLGIGRDNTDYVPVPVVRRSPPRQPQRSAAGVPISVLKRLWDESMAMSHQDAGPLRTYLRSRGLGDVVPHSPASIRFHPAMRLKQMIDGEMRDFGLHPAMLSAALGKDGRVTALHRTYLAPDGNGKAKVPPGVTTKKILSAKDREFRGLAVRLHRPRKVLGVTEGIETGLSVFLLSGMPVWPVLSSSYFPSLFVPEHVEHLVIWMDHDRTGAGTQYGEKLKKRMAAERPALRVTIVSPAIVMPQDDVDWNDAWKVLGAGAFSQEVKALVEGRHFECEQSLQAA